VGISFRGERGTRHFIANERGQSLVEYILMLFVSVALVLGLIFEFSSAFKAWANNYFGDYLTCLLETGELPSIGGTPGDSGTCNQFFQAFSLKNGRPSTALGKGSGENKSTANPSGLNRSGARREGTVARTSSGGGNWNGSGNGGGNNKLADTSEDGGGGAAAKTGNTGISSGGGGGSRMSKSGSGDGGRQLDGRLGILVKKDAETKKGYAPNTARSDVMTHSPKRVRLKEARKPAEVRPDEPMTFGNFIRILIMAALIIALVVVIGGQVLQATKGMDASD
jgi:Flp pilus assembly pilin Flp